MSALPSTLLLGAALAVLAVPGAAEQRLAALQVARRAPGPTRPRTVGLPALPRPVLVPVAALAGLLVGGPGLAVLAAVAATLGGRQLRRRHDDAERLRERRRVVEACAALAAELRAGRSPAEGLEVAAALASGGSAVALRSATAAARLGGDVPAALLREHSAAVPEVLRALAACWQVCSRSGAGLAAAVDRLADGLRTRQAQERAVQAALAGPRATAGLLAVLPLAGTALAAGLGADPLHVLLRTPLGLVCLFVGVALDLLGLWWTGRIVARAAAAS